VESDYKTTLSDKDFSVTNMCLALFCFFVSDRVGGGVFFIVNQLYITDKDVKSKLIANSFKSLANSRRPYFALKKYGNFFVCL